MFVDDFHAYKNRVMQYAGKFDTMTEEATKNALIMPFLVLLGYDVFDPEEIMPEYVCDVAGKKGEKIDYVILHDGKPEAKSGGKTKAATRTVYIPKVLIDFLAVQPRTSLLVVTTTTGQPMTVSAWRRLWDSYMCELNLKYGDFLVPPKSKYQPGGVPMVIPAFTAHWLRHTFVTNMYNAGVDVAIARDQAGHSDIKTTLEIYTTLDKENRRSDMAKLNDYIGVSDGCQAKKQMA